MEYSENISAVFRELVLFLRAGTLRKDSLCRSNGPGEGGDLLSPRGLIDPGKPGYQE